MGSFLSFVKKEALHILRDSRTMLIVLGMPVVQMLLFGFAISTEIRNIDFAVVAPHPTEAVRRAVETVGANEYFTFKGYVTQPEIDRTRVRETPTWWSCSLPISTGRCLPRRMGNPRKAPCS